MHLYELMIYVERYRTRLVQYRDNCLMLSYNDLAKIDNEISRLNHWIKWAQSEVKVEIE